MTTYIKHNLLDDIRINEVIDQSLYLKRYLEEGYHHFDDFTELLKDINFMLFKHVVLVEKEQSNFHLELILELKRLKLVDQIRLRTSGSLTNTYLCLKLILDGLFESIRGTNILEEFNQLIKEHDNQTLNDLDGLLSQREKELLDKILEHEHVQASNRHDLLRAIDELIHFEEEDSPLNQAIEQALKKQPNSFEDLLEEASKKLDEDIFEKTDQEKIESARIKEEMDKRFSPYLNKQILTKGQTFEKGQFQSKLESDSKESHTAFSNEPINDKDQVIHTEAHQINHETNKLYGHTQVDTITKQALKEQVYNKKKRKLFEKLKLPRIIHKALAQVDQFEETSKTLGINKKSLDLLTFDQVIQLYKRYQKPDFISFINKVGRNKRFARQMQYKKRKKHAIPIDKVTTSNKIDLLIDDEYISLALGIEAFENDFYDRYLKDDLLTIELINKFDKRKGPIILCYDGSGSMEGVKIEETKSHIIAILEIAKIQKRHMVIIQFASASEPLYIKEINPKQLSANDVMDIMDTFICGGTDFEKPLSKAIDYINKDKHKKSDILFITDGQCEIKETFKDKFLMTKKRRDFKLYTMIMHSHTYHDYGDIADISDEILEIHDRDFNNWNSDTKGKLYSLI